MTLTAKLDHSESFNGKVVVNIINSLYAGLPMESWMRTPDKLLEQAPRVLAWTPRDRKPVVARPVWHFDDVSCVRILEDADIMEHILAAYVGATTSELVYEAGYRSAQGPVAKGGALRAYPEFCEPIAEAHKGNPLYWRGWFDRGAGWEHNKPTGVLRIPMTLGCAISMWEFFEDPQQFDTDAAAGFATRTLFKSLIALKRLYLEPEFDESLCHATPGHRRELVTQTRLLVAQLK
jgi:hypothetical protein